MKKSIIILLGVCCVFMSGRVWAQDADTLDVAPGFGTLNIAVGNDTTAGGAPINPNRVYRLQRGGTYILNGRVGVFNPEFHFRLYANPDDGTPPPLVMPGVLSDGTNDKLLDLSGDVTFENVFFINKDVLGNNGPNYPVEFRKDSLGTIIIDRCGFEHGDVFLSVRGKNARFFMTNTLVRNLVSLGSWFGGRTVFFWHNEVEEAVFENNTFEGVGGFTFQVRKNFAKRFWFNHNTIYHNGKMPFLMERWTNCVMVNNLLIDCHVTGESFKRGEENGQDVDGLLYGIFGADTLESYDGAPVSTDQAVVLLASNNHYRNPVYDTYYESTMTTDGDSVFGEPFMNERTQGLFDSYGNFQLLNLTNEDPQFVSPPEYTEKYIQWLTDRRAGNELVTWSWDPDAATDSISWPVPEDMAYTNSNLLTAGTDGLPLGDLNWFPEQLADWEANKDAYDAQILDLVTGVSAATNAVPSAFALEQNYPNPFNPITTIAFTLDKAVDVKLTVFNVMGQKVKTLVNQRMVAGSHSVRWNGTNVSGNKVNSGMYFYRLESGSQSKAMKMLLVK